VTAVKNFSFLQELLFDTLHTHFTLTHTF